MSDQGSHIGTLIKPHGFKGELQMKGQPLHLDTIEIGNPLFISIDGQRIPFFVENISDTSQPDRLVIKFEFIDGIEEARKYVSLEVYSENSSIEKPGDDKELSSMIDFKVLDTVSGQTALVSDYIESTENPLLILKLGKQEIMLPLNADYIESIDYSAKEIRVALPEGLIDLD